MTKYITIAIITILCVFSIVNQIRYSKLKQEYLILQLQLPNGTDSLKQVNELLNKKIIWLEDATYQLSDTIDSLKRVKQTITVDFVFKEAETFSDGVKVLKHNLQCERK